MVQMTQKEMLDYDMIVELGIATADELNLAFNLVPGDWTHVFSKVLAIRTGYHSLDQYLECEVNEEE